MWRITSFFKRSVPLDRLSAIDRWLTQFFHPAAEGLGAAGCGRAIANLPFDVPVEGLPDNFDAVAEFWFDNISNARDGLSKLHEIHAQQTWLNLSSPATPPPWIGEVRSVLADGPLGIKVIRAGRPARGVDVRDALTYWREHHADVAKTATQFWALLTRYTQVPAVDPDNIDAFPLHADVGAASVGDMKAAFAHPEYFAIVQPDERKFSLAGKLLADRLYFASSRELTAFDRYRA